MLKLKSLNFHKNENKKGVILPKMLTPKLAEDIGWHIGDGSMNIYNKGKSKLYYIKIAGDPNGEKLFYDNVIIPTKQKLYGIALNAIDIGDGSYGLRIYSKVLLLFYNQVFGIPLSPKKNITIPDAIKKSEDNIVLACIRGIFDTDGTLTFSKKRRNKHHYPLIQIENISKILITDIKKILENFGFTTYVELNMKRPTPSGYDRVTHRLSIYGKGNLDKWFNKVGFRNQKHLTKYRIWKRFGFCPTHTTLEERFKILKGTITLDNFYKD